MIVRAKATTVTVNKSTSTGNTRNKARSHINTSGIVKYLGHEANSGTTKFRKSSTGSSSHTSGMILTFVLIVTHFFCRQKVFKF